MFKVLESIDFCIFIRHSLAFFSPNSSFILFRTSSEYPPNTPNTSTMMLICLTTYWVSILHFPSKWCILCGLFCFFFPSVSNPRNVILLLLLLLSLSLSLSLSLLLLLLLYIYTYFYFYSFLFIGNRFLDL